MQQNLQWNSPYPPDSAHSIENSAILGSEADDGAVSRAIPRFRCLPSKLAYSRAYPSAPLQ